MPTCCICGENKPRSQYSNRQLRRKQLRKCNQCTESPTTHKNKGWIKCSPAPKLLSQILQLDEFNFIALSTLSTIHIFNSLKQDWSHPDNLQHIADNIQSISIQSNKKILYIITIQSEECIILPYTYNLKYEFFPLLSFTSKIKCCKDDSISSIFVKDSFHILHRHYDIKRGRKTKNLSFAFHHYTFHPDSSKLERVGKFTDECKAGFIYLPIKDQLFAFDKYDLKLYNHSDKTWSDPINDKTASSSYYNYPIGERGYISTRDDQYLLFFVGSSWPYGNDIEVINTKIKYPKQNVRKNRGLNNRWNPSRRAKDQQELSFDTCKGSKIKCPEPGGYVAFLTQHFVLNDRIIYGYFRSCWNFRENMTPILPFDIVQVIAKMEKNEGDVVHLIKKDNGKHFKINLKYIARFR